MLWNRKRSHSFCICQISHLKYLTLSRAIIYINCNFYCNTKYYVKQRQCTWLMMSSTQWYSSNSTNASIGASLNTDSFRLVSSHSFPLFSWWSSSSEILEALDFDGSRDTKSWAKCRHLTDKTTGQREIAIVWSYLAFIYLSFHFCFKLIIQTCYLPNFRFLAVILKLN